MLITSSLLLQLSIVSRLYLRKLPKDRNVEFLRIHEFFISLPSPVSLLIRQRNQFLNFIEFKMYTDRSRDLADS